MIASVQKVKVMGEGCEEPGKQMISVLEKMVDRAFSRSLQLGWRGDQSEEETKRRKRERNAVEKTRQRRGASEDAENG